jgi:hypothetical protein
MLKRIQAKKSQHRRKHSPGIVLLLVGVWSLLLGWGMAIAIETPKPTDRLVSSQEEALQEFPIANNSLQPATLSSGNPDTANPATLLAQTVDPVPQSYTLGQELYLQNCASCHIAVPPAVLPTETWRDLLQDQQHYGTQVPRLMSPAILIVWNYLRTFSRPKLPDEAPPYRVGVSRYFKALHPRVKFSQPVQLATCISCHSNASQYNFRKLTPEWQNAP